MPVIIPTLDRIVDYQTLRAFNALKAHADALEATVAQLNQTVNSIPSAPSLAQINTALSAGGSNPLNLTGLIGTSQVAATQQASSGGGGPVNTDPLPPEPPPGTDPAPIPNPTPTPPGPPGHAGGDDIPLASILFINSPPLTGMTSTGVMTGLAINSGGFNPDFTTEGTWPDVPIPGWRNPDGSSGTLRFTLWMILNIGGQWYGSGVIQFWGNLAYNGGPPQYVGAPNPASGQPDWFYGSAWGPMSHYQPAVGEMVGFLVTAGNQRQGANDHIVAERSNIVEVPYPSASGATFSWTLP